MNILFITTHLNVGGIAKYVLTLAAALKKRGHNIIVASSGGDLVGELEKSGIKHLYIGINTKSELSPKIIFVLRDVLKIIKNNNIEIIHAHTRVTQVVAYLASKIAKVPYTATAHGFYKKRLGRLFFKCFGDKTIAISEPVKNGIVETFKISPSDISTIHTGIDLVKFLKTYSDEEKNRIKNKFGIKGSPIIGTVGRLSEEKGQIYLLKAFKGVLENGFPEANLIIVGDGKIKEGLKNYVSVNNLGSKVFFLGTVKDTPEILSILDIFTLPSLKEGLGLSLIEAMAAGIPSVATLVGGIPDLIKNNESGILVSAEDETALCDGILKLLKNKDLAAKVASNGKAFAKENFSIDDMARKVEEFYKKIERIK